MIGELFVFYLKKNPTQTVYSLTEEGDVVQNDRLEQAVGFVFVLELDESLSPA